MWRKDMAQTIKANFRYLVIYLPCVRSKWRVADPGLDWTDPELKLKKKNRLRNQNDKITTKNIFYFSILDVKKA